jgi:hypothetical protein
VGKSLQVFGVHNGIENRTGAVPMDGAALLMVVIIALGISAILILHPSRT